MSHALNTFIALQFVLSLVMPSLLKSPSKTNHYYFYIYSYFALLRIVSVIILCYLSASFLQGFILFITGYGDIFGDQFIYYFTPLSLVAVWFGSKRLIRWYVRDLKDSYRKLREHYKLMNMLRNRSKENQS